jgi:hypothetical protein
LAFCNPNKELNLSNDVLIVLYPHDISDKANTLNDTKNSIKYSKEFWDYFISSHPRVSMTIFAHHLYAEHYPSFIINDTSFKYYPIGLYTEDLSELLSDTPGGIEKSKLNISTVWNNEFKYVPTARHVSENTAREFESFKRILSFRDKSKYYVIIYRENIVQLILH